MPAIDPDKFRDMDEPINVDGDPEEVLKLLLAVDPDSDPVGD
jgi:hypothetical protein